MVKIEIHLEVNSITFGAVKFWVITAWLLPADIFKISDQRWIDDEERPQTAPEGRGRGGWGGGEEEKRLFLLAEQTEAFLLVFFSFARAGLGSCCRGNRSWQRLSACGGGGRAMAAGSDLRLLAWHSGRDGRDPHVHLLLEEREERGRRQ